MTTSRLWAIAAGAAVLAIAVVIVLTFVVPRTPAAAPTTTPTRFATMTPTPTPTPSATPTRTAEPAVEVSCETISTAEFQGLVQSSGWQSWTLPRDGIGNSPFETFPNGLPDGGISCRWGADPDLATDNIFDLAWAPIDPESAGAAMQYLSTTGYERIETAEGTYLASRGEQPDAEGYSDSYFFGFDDVRWAHTKADLAYVTTPFG